MIFDFSKLGKINNMLSTDNLFDSCGSIFFKEGFSSLCLKPDSGLSGGIEICRLVETPPALVLGRLYV